MLHKILDNPIYNTSDRKLISQAFEFASIAHEGQKRFSGENYINHPLATAYFLSKLGLDSVTIAAALLHDILEDTKVKNQDLKKEFGEEITFLVESVTKLGRLEYSAKPHGRINKSATDQYMASLKKMFFAMAEDIRVILIKLTDRYHNMTTLNYLPRHNQKRVATETMEIYAPIAGRLGMGKLKGELEDTAFPYIYPDEYSWLMKKVKEKYNDRIKYIERTKPLIKRRLTDAGIKVLDIHSRAKHYYSLYRKIERKAVDPDKIFDLVAMRIIVSDIKSCYETLGVIHHHYKPLPGLIKDYIALPKPNGYQSIHTTIFCEKGRVAEIQIRTEDMHDHAENGIAAHWAYSENGKKRSVKANIQETQWINQLKEFLNNETPSTEGLTSLKIDFFKNRIFAFTPKGEVKDLPEGATPIDFAYSIHTNLGHSITGAKTNGRMVPFDHKLQNGDMVEIIRGKNLKPSFDWLKIVKTTEAKKKIKSWFNKDKPKPEEKEEKKEKIRESIKKIKSKLTVKEGMPIIEGQTGLMYKLSECCKPKSTQKIVGYMTLNKGVSIHTVSCANIKNAAGERILKVIWR